MFRFLCSKKGLTFVELMIVVVVLGILTSVAVPIFYAGLNKQRKSDCRNQCLVVQTTVQQIMYGMIDNGARQEKINISSWADGGSLVKKQHNPGAPKDNLNIDSSYNYKYYTVLDKNLTLGQIRGGYRNTDQYPDYKDGCKNGQYLKKQSLADIPVYEYFSNAEFPVCPFDEDGTKGYCYVIFEDGSVFCTCPECNE